MSEQEVNPNVEAVVDPLEAFKITSKDGKVLYTTSQEELDECFYSVIALSSWSKTFAVGSKLKLTFSTISDDQKMELLASMRVWADKNDASSNMFDQQLNKVNLAYYLSYIEINGSTINLREKKMDERIVYLGSMTEAALTLYGTYIFVFLEIIRLALIGELSLKNS